MTTLELDVKLMLGTPLDKLLDLTEVNNRRIFKAKEFTVGDDIVYIRALDVTEIPPRSKLTLPEIREVIRSSYTGKDFMEVVDWNVEAAKALFGYCDGQAPAAALAKISREMEQEESTPPASTPIYAVVAVTSMSDYTEPHYYSSAPDHEEVVSLWFSEEKAKEDADSRNEADKAVVEATDCDPTDYIVRQYFVNP